MIIEIAVFFIISLILIAKNAKKERDKRYEIYKKTANHRLSCKCDDCNYIRNYLFPK